MNFDRIIWYRGSYVWKAMKINENYFFRFWSCLGLNTDEQTKIIHERTITVQKFLEDEYLRLSTIIYEYLRVFTSIYEHLYENLWKIIFWSSELVCTALDCPDH